MSLDPKFFYKILHNNNIEFFTGVPDSLLKEFCLCLDHSLPNNSHIIAANEGNAISIAAGHYLATKKIPMVYMQNSGLGNAVNPLLSLCDSEVYGIPMLLMIGWRGEPGVIDEPQHLKQGKIQTELLETMGIPYKIINSESKDCETAITDLLIKSKKNSSPVALLIKKNTFQKFNKNISSVNEGMKREEALNIILDKIKTNNIVVSTTGKTSREIFELREFKKQSHSSDFLTVGSMGHCSSIALGIAIAKPKRQVICIDGDGSLIMHLGSITTIASLRPENFRYILLNNGVHESVGGQDTAAKNVDLSAIINSLKLSEIFKAGSVSELKSCFDDFLSIEGPSFIEVKIQPGSREDLGRPTIKPIVNKDNFMRFLDKK